MSPLVLFFKAGVACCLPTCAKGSSVLDEGNVSFGIFWVLWFLLGGFVHMWSPSIAGLPVVYKAWVTQVCLLLDTPFGRRSVGALPL